MDICIGILASVWPIILAPKLSVIASQATSMTQTMLQSGAMMAAMAGSGMGSGMMNSGALPGTKGLDMSKGQQFKTLMTSGMTGAAMGGASQITPMNIPGPAQKGVTDAVNNNLAEGNVNQTLSEFDPSPQISNGHVANPGNLVGSMIGDGSGQNIANNSAKLDQTADNFVKGMPDPQRIPGKEIAINYMKSNPGIANSASY